MNNFNVFTVNLLTVDKQLTNRWQGVTNPTTAHSNSGGNMQTVEISTSSKGVSYMWNNGLLHFNPLTFLPVIIAVNHLNILPSSCINGFHYSTSTSIPFMCLVNHLNIPTSSCYHSHKIPILIRFLSLSSIVHFITYSISMRIRITSFTQVCI